MIDGGLLKFFSENLIIKARQAKLLLKYYDISEIGVHNPKVYEQKTKLFLKVHELNQVNKIEQQHKPVVFHAPKGSVTATIQNEKSFVAKCSREVELQR